jgi:hypothetical protein
MAVTDPWPCAVVFEAGRAHVTRLQARVGRLLGLSPRNVFFSLFFVFIFFSPFQIQIQISILDLNSSPGFMVPFQYTQPEPT